MAETLGCVLCGIFAGFVSPGKFLVMEDHPLAEVFRFQVCANAAVSGYIPVQSVHVALLIA